MKTKLTSFTFCQLLYFAVISNATRLIFDFGNLTYMYTVYLLYIRQFSSDFENLKYMYFYYIINIHAFIYSTLNSILLLYTFDIHTS